ncbi:MAGUK p55 subfamily member 4 isoform X1 [Molossus molossus]|uniref:Membrane palmitoylated protein 4 n=1 Tax=Molossus molossus TaxID=27622 RepID=A0A7J8FT59_MOLMO|nr:MAGUK p55 subfamily member 4 isoform X1 [Molossus molossus]XP_036110309.1 MAGUK p55 subfamily member 4 isoform X1 [Molossus molossus]XP_036110310.1 MAGUK p55 subfamily member 4 isoform X1 [Molossus molossus]XP_036110311.1 MAGUK p55 subfamily member 4 isoform X1 [Molossus molossus]KAF6450685.1 membrane palmitoylated protein 4 [Molossus molossus]
MIQSDKEAGPLDKKDTRHSVASSPESDPSQILRLVLQELNLFYRRDMKGLRLLYDLLHSPWLQALLKVYDCLQEFKGKSLVPATSHAQALSYAVVELLHAGSGSPEVPELRRILQAPHFKALLSAHDTVARKDFEPLLPPLPDNIPETEEAMRIVCLVKNQQPLGATIKRHETTGDILVARIIHGGLAERSGLLYAGDKLVEVNGVSVEGLDPEQVIHILAMSRGTIMFKVVPVSDPPVRSPKMVYVRAMTEYWPQEDPSIPCVDAGLPFQKGDILQIVDQNDALWWQARKISDLRSCAGLIPSNHLLKRKQRKFWWSQPYQPDTHLKSTISISMEEEDDMKIDEKCVEAEELSEDKEEFVGYGQKFFIAGFRRSMRLCRRKSHLSQLRANMGCASSCHSALGAPYEEVVRYQRRPSDRHRLIVLMGPSGVGVNALRRQLVGLNPNDFRGAVPHTTRPKKSYEMDGREYHYVSKEIFETLMYSHRMLEYGEYKGHFYGTSVDAVQAVLDEGKICVMDLEPQGIQVARTHELKPYIIFIKPPNMNCMKRSRKNAKVITDYFVDMKFKDEDLQEMEDLALKMETQFGQFFDHVIVNDSLQDAYAQLLSAVQKAQEEPQWVPATWVSSDTES